MPSSYAWPSNNRQSQHLANNLRHSRIFLYIPGNTNKLQYLALVQWQEIHGENATRWEVRLFWKQRQAHVHLASLTCSRLMSSNPHEKTNAFIWKEKLTYKSRDTWLVAEHLHVFRYKNWGHSIVKAMVSCTRVKIGGSASETGKLGGPNVTNGSGLGLCWPPTTDPCRFAQRIIYGYESWTARS